MIKWKRKSIRTLWNYYELCSIWWRFTVCVWEDHCVGLQNFPDRKSIRIMNNAISRRSMLHFMWNNQWRTWGFNWFCSFSSDDDKLLQSPSDYYDSTFHTIEKSLQAEIKVFFPGVRRGKIKRNQFPSFIIRKKRKVALPKNQEGKKVEKVDQTTIISDALWKRKDIGICRKGESFQMWNWLDSNEHPPK